MIGRSGRRAALFVGLAALAACGDGASPPMGVVPPGTTETVRITGTAVTADHGPLPALEVLAYSGFDTVSTLADDSGAFGLDLTRPEGEPVTVVLSERDDARDGYLPALKTFPGDAVTTDLVALLIPSRFTVPSGRFAGQEVAMSLQAAIAPENQLIEGGNGGFFFISRWLHPDMSDGMPLGAGVDVDATRSFWTSAWDPTHLPLPLYFEHTGMSRLGGTRGPISAEDSTTIWMAIADLEDRLGLDLFEPAVRSALPADTLDDSGASREERLFAVSLEMIPDLAAPGAAGGFAGVEASCQRFLSDACERYGEGELILGAVTLSSLDDATPELARWLVEHELIHALGFGHSCFRPSIMAGCAGPYPGVTLGADTPDLLASVYDVAFIHWYRMIHRRTLEVRPHFGIVEALDGERRRSYRAPVRTELRCAWGEWTEACLDVPPPAGVPPVP